MEQNKRFLRLPEVIDRTGLGRSTIYLMIVKNAFPKSISLGTRAVGWVEKDVNDWIEKQINISKKTRREK